jgi:protein required for attachment to host cells
MLVPHGTLIVAADGGHFCLYRNSGKGYAIELELLAESEFANPKTSKLGDGPPGRAFHSTSKSRSSYEQADLHDREENAFAEMSAACLHDYARDSDSAVILIADPRMLGRLRERMGDALQKRIVCEINRDYAMRKPDEIIALLRRIQPD